MRILIPDRLMLAVVAALGVCVMLGFFSVKKSLDALEQPQLTRQREGFEIHTVHAVALKRSSGDSKVDIRVP
ncbi:MAG: hypothetical protein HQ518_27400 [Rhodopirellula sp.]|nr:hypothetical protein [Rhodopirellula sp.]